MSHPRKEAWSPQPAPRTIGVIWLLYFLTAFLGAFLSKGLVVPSDVAATATNILAHTTLYRAGGAFDLVANALYIALTALLYGLFRPVNRSLALVAAFFSLVGCTVQIMGGLLRLAPTVVLTDAHLSTVFTTQQLQAAALFSVGLYNRIFEISFVLFGFFELVVGYLIFKSTFLPRALGWWWIVGGAGWLMFLWPPLAVQLRPIILAGGAAEVVLMLWLLVKGVDAARWQENAT